MATTKIFPISVDEVASLKYIANPEKTDNSRLIITSGCSSEPLQASKGFEEMRVNGTGKSTILSQHFIVSFKPGEITTERALQVGQEICEQFLKGEYQYFLTYHIDNHHLPQNIKLNKYMQEYITKFNIEKEILSTESLNQKKSQLNESGTFYTYF